MKADICSPDDSAAVERFRSALRRLGATEVAKEWVPDVDHYRLRIGDAELTIFIDQWTLDIEGPDELVHQVLSEYGQPPRATW